MERSRLRECYIEGEENEMKCSTGSVDQRKTPRSAACAPDAHLDEVVLQE